MKKWIWISPLCVCILAGGGWYADHRVKQAVGNKVVSMLSQPSTQKQLQQIINATKNDTAQQSTKPVSTSKSDHGNQNETSSQTAETSKGEQNTNSQVSTGHTGESTTTQTGTTHQTSVQQHTGNTPQFTSRQQVVQFAMSRFSQAEIAHFMKLYAERSNLSEAQKNEIKQEILSHFSPSEIQAMEAAVSN